MTLGDLVRFSGGALRGHRLRTGLSLLGVGIGVASVVVLTGLGEGARRYVTGEFAELGTNLLIVVPGKIETTGVTPLIGGVPNDLTLDDAAAIDRDVPRVSRLAPMTLGSAPIRFADRSREVNIIGTTPDLREIRQLKVQAGTFLPEIDPRRGQRVCVIGAKIRRELFGDRNALGAAVRIGDYRFRVIGVLAPRGFSIGFDVDELVYVPVANGLKMFDQPSLFRIFAQVRAHDEMEAAERDILTVLTARHDGEEDVTILTQDAVLSAFGQVLATLTVALVGIAAISLTVAGIGIMNVMLVSVSERTREIGLLKALGAGRGQILLSFLVEAAILSTAGGLLGLAIGYLAGRAFMVIYPGFPVHTPLWAVLWALGVSLAVGVVFGALPARRAARLEPVTALAGGH